MTSAGSWRDKLFETGTRYRVLKDYEFFGSSFKAGLVVEYESCGYERYDSTSLYRFYSEDPGREVLVWRLHDDEPEAKANEYFQKIA